MSLQTQEIEKYFKTTGTRATNKEAFKFEIFITKLSVSCERI
jgi:hypothetical protein